MIQIIKPDQSPEVLTTKGKERTRLDCEEFERHTKEYLSGKLKMAKADNKIYGDSAMKDVLLTAQNNKCCYCERSRDRVELDVEHYRPKGAVKQTQEG